MRLTYTCRICKKQNFLQHKEKTRPELQMKMAAEEVKVNCNNCGKFDKRHINRITAIADYRVIFMGVILGILGTIILWNFLGAIAIFTFSIPLYFWRYESEQAHKFNSYAIKRK
jgi:endogenous inhibitor of DNA gyrase (YacG/DUF329 family)